MTRKRSHGNGPTGAGAMTMRLFDLVVDAGAVIAAVLLVAVMLATTIKVVFRYGLREGLIGVDQISGTMLLYITFLGAPGCCGATSTSPSISW